MPEWETVVTAGVWFVALDASGKPVDEPVLAVEAVGLTAPAATWAGDHYALALEKPPACAESGASDDCDIGRQEVRLWFVDDHGSTDSLPGPVTVTDRWAGWRTSVAAGPDGYGVLVLERGEGDTESDSVRFVWVSRDLDEIRTSGTLGNSAGGEVVYTGDRFAAGWLDVDTEARDSARFCVARFLVGGRLEHAPVCHEPLTTEAILETYPTRLAYGDGGFGLAVMLGVEGTGMTHTDATLWFQRTDDEGAAVGRPHLITRGSWSEVSVRRYGVGFGAGDFAVLYEHQDFHDGMVLRLQRFTPR